MLLKDKMKNSKMMFGGRRHKSGSGEGASWAVSYVDMLTLLLCFFIIFYNLKPENDVSKGGSKEQAHPTELSALQRIAINIQTTISQKDAPHAPLGSKTTGEAGTGSGSGTGTEMNLGAGSGSGPGTGTGTGTGSGTGTGKFTTGTNSESGATSAPVSMAGIREKVKDIGSTDIQAVGESLEINFKGVSFFNSRSVTLTSDAKQLIDRVVEVLKPTMNGIRITVQGHTDSRAMTNSENNIHDNWELSVLRATSVLKRFASEGFPQDALSAEGFAATRTIASDPGDLASQRKITLRIEPK